MGLDITAYRKLIPAPGVDLEEGDNWDTHMRACLNPNFPGRADGLNDATIYTFAEQFGFRAGSYSGYNRWRDQLCRLAHGIDAEQFWERTDGLPQDELAKFAFGELIQFADNEGTIGPLVSAKLAKDFAEYQERAETIAASADRYWLESYADWRKAFEMAADGGAVDFH